MEESGILNQIFKLFLSSEEERKTDSKTYNSVAVAKFDGMGDFVIFLDFASHLREMYPGKTITLFTTPNNEYMAKQSELFDDVLIFDNYSIKEENIIQTYNAVIKKYRFDYLLNPTSSRHIHPELLCALIYAKVKIAAKFELADNITAYQKYLAMIYDAEVETGQRNMMLIQNARFARVLGFDGVKASIPKLRFVHKMPIEIKEKYCIVFIGGSFPEKCWHLDGYKAVIKHILNKHGLKCVICGVESDCDAARDIENTGLSGIINLVGKTDLDELMTLISHSDFVLGNDTSAAHFAVALGVQSFVISGQFAADRFFPYRTETEAPKNLPVCIKVARKCAGCSFDYMRKFSCINHHKFQKLSCVNAVSVDCVINAIDDYFSGVANG